MSIPMEDWVCRIDPDKIEENFKEIPTKILAKFVELLTIGIEELSQRCAVDMFRFGDIEVSDVRLKALNHALVIKEKLELYAESRPDF